jgi:VIT1/CCC1 family predicted Fe2+/Mn2+ transporter
LPLLLVVFVPFGDIIFAVIGASMVLLLVLGGLAARLGRAPLLRGALRVAFWGAVAMGATALVGHLFGAVA